jgi:two-component system NtrC family response regulator
MKYLQSLPYPGNIRELKNLVERTILVSAKETLDAEDFKAQNSQPAGVTTTQSLNGLTLDELERQRILQALEQYGNNLSQVATALGLSRPALYRRLEKHNIVI